VRIRTPVYDAAILSLVVAGVSLVIGACTGVNLLTVAGGVLIASSYALTWYAARCLLPASAEFGELRTFRDLAVVVAAGRPTEPNAAADGGLDSGFSEFNGSPRGRRC